MPRRPKLETGLSRRHRQIMDALFALGEGSVADVHARLPEAPTDTAVRTLLGLLCDQGHVQRRTEGRRVLYRPAVPRETAGRDAFQRIVDVFFGGSLEDALAAHLRDPKSEIDATTYRRLQKLINEARKESS